MPGVSMKNWKRVPGAADCPECKSDTLSDRLVGDGENEWRRCEDNPEHRFQREARVHTTLSEATVFDV